MSDDNPTTQGGDDNDDQDPTGGHDPGTDANDQDPDGDQNGDGGDGDDTPLGPAGQKALDAIKAKHKKEMARRRQLEAELAATKGASGDETERARQEAEQAALAKANNRILKAEVKAAAAGKLADPSDAWKFLDLDQFEVGADGEIDTDELTSAIDELIKTKPYLAATTTPTKRFQGGADGGVRGKTKGIDQQIADAEAKGEWKTARQLKLQKQYGAKK